MGMIVSFVFLIQSNYNNPYKREMVMVREKCAP